MNFEHYIHTTKRKNNKKSIHKIIFINPHPSFLQRKICYQYLIFYVRVCYTTFDFYIECGFKLFLPWFVIACCATCNSFCGIRMSRRESHLHQKKHQPNNVFGNMILRIWMSYNICIRTVRIEENKNARVWL